MGSECGDLSWCKQCVVQASTVDVVEELVIATVCDSLEELGIHETAGESTSVDDDSMYTSEKELPKEGPVTLNISTLAGPLCIVEVDRAWQTLQVKSGGGAAWNPILCTDSPLQLYGLGR